METTHISNAVASSLILGMIMQFVTDITSFANVLNSL